MSAQPPSIRGRRVTQAIVINLAQLRELMAKFIAECDGDTRDQLTLSLFLEWMRRREGATNAETTDSPTTLGSVRNGRD